MNIFAFAIIPVMFSVHTVVSWDFAMATRPGWASTIFGPYFVIGALHSGIAAVLIVIFIIRATMKNMKYFLRPEHFDFLGKLSLIVSMSWAYFFFNDYLVPWYGGGKFDKLLLDFQQHGPFAWVWVTMLICNVVIPWAILWNKKWRRTPWLMLLVGIVIVVGHVDRALCHHSHLADHHAHAFHLAPVQAFHRNPDVHWHFRAFLAAVHDRLSADPTHTGLGSPGRAGGSPGS